ncbi:MAG: PA14 domain-containing protein, partial [Planctomycetota bacterium]|nr:PA14 domain-containing protein [Planctomycetota bacterium]
AALDTSDVPAVGNGGVVVEGLALHYNFQEVAAGAVADQSGNGRDGSLVGDPEAVESESTEVARDTVVITIEARNEGPHASAGPDQSVAEGDTVQLVGSGTDPEGQSISYTWVQTAGTPVTLDDPSAASPQFEAPEGLVNSDITFELQVSDGVNTSADQITVTVNADNDSPSSSAGEDQTVQEGDAVTLSGSGTDPEGQGLTYTWVQTSGPDVVLSDNNAANPTFDSPGVANNSDLVFELQVSDGENVSVDTVTIHLVAEVFVPSAEAGSDFAVSEGETVQLVADTSGNNQSLDLSEYTLSRYGGGQDAHGDYEVIYGGEGLRIGGNSWASMDLAYTVTADTILEFDYRNTGNAEISGIGFDTDSSINSNRTFKVSGTQNWGIQSGFDAYSADDGEWQKIQIRVGDFYTGDFDSLFFVNDHDAGSRDSEGFFANINLYEAGDAVAQDVTYTWVQTSGTPVVLDDIHSPTPTFDAPEGLVNSDVTFELQVSDGTTVSTDSITVTIQADDDAPSASAGSNQTVDEGDVVQLSGSGSDPEGQGLTYQWVQTSGTSVVLDDATAATPSFDAPEGLVNSDITFELRISDGTNDSTDSVTVTVNADNDAPSTNAGPDQVVDEGDVVVLSGSANDPEGQTLTYSWVQTSGPAVILDDASSASPTFSAPEGLDATDVTFKLTVSDGTHQSVDTVAVTIQADNDGPSADAGSDQAVHEGDVVTLRGSGVDPEGQDLTYRWVQTGGPDIVLDDPTNAAPTFVAPEGLANVDFTFELQVSDGESMQADLVTVTVNADNDAPSAVASVPKPGMWNYEYFDLPGSSYSNLDQAGFTLEGGSQSSLTPTETGVTDSLNPSDFDTGDLFGLRMTTQLVIDEAGSYDFQSYADDGVRLFVDGIEVLEDDGLHAARNASGDPVELTAGVHELTVVYFENRGAQVLDVSISGPDTGDAFVSLGGYPGVNAGSQTVVDEGQLVQLDGSASSDPESEGLTYRWVQTGGSTVVLSDANSATPSFVAPEGLINSNITFELQVSDGTNVSTDTVTLLVNADNDAPTAEAGSHQAVQELDTVQLVGSGVDPEGEGLSYQWVQTSGTPVVLDDATSSNPTFQAPEGLVNSDLNFELRVSDGVHTSVDTVVITVGADNDAPSSDAGPDQVAQENATVQLAGSGLDPEAQGVTFEWVQVSGPSVVLDDFTAPDPIFSAPEMVANTEVVFELRVSDGVHTTSDTVSVMVNADNDAPSAEAGPNQSVAEGAIVQMTGAGEDPEGEGLTYNWVQVSGPAVVLDQADTATPTFDAPNWLSNSDVAFELHVSDGTNTSVDTVTITIQADDDAPSCGAGFDQTVVENSTVQLGGFAEDPEGQGLTYTWVQTSGPSVVLSDAHSLEPTFASPDLVANSDITFELRVSDGVNTSVDSVTIAVNADDDAPSADAGPNQAVEENSEVQLRGVGVDPEGTGLTYTWLQTSGPTVTLSGADTASPTFTAPELLSNTDVVFELSVSDGTNVSVDTVTVTVGADNDSPAIDAGADLRVQEDDLVQLRGQATDPEGQGLTYEWIQTAGPSVELMNADSATPTFVAPNLAADAEAVFELRVSDGVNTAVDTMVVQIVADDDSPVNVDAGSDQMVEELDQVQLIGLGTDLEGQDLTYRWVQTSGTPVVLDDAHSDSPQFRAPEGLVNSDLTFELQVSDGLHTTTDTVTVTVQADDDAPSADAGADQTVNELDAVHLAGTGVDPEGEGLTYQWVQTGGPTVTLDDPSSENPRFVSPDGLANTDFTFELRVSDGVNVSSDTVTITVNADNDAPIADAGVDLMVPEGEWVQLESASSDPE